MLINKKPKTATATVTDRRMIRKATANANLNLNDQNTTTNHTQFVLGASSSALERHRAYRFNNVKFCLDRFIMNIY